jgi:hypothetical protein
MTDQHAERELEIFRAFALASGIVIDLQSIKKRPPPAPDILCSGRNGLVAFELVQLIDREKIGRRQSNKKKLEERFDQVYQLLPDERQNQIPNTRISIKIPPSARLKTCLDSVSTILEAIMFAGPKFEGKLPLPRDLHKLAAVMVGSAHGSRHKPLFDVNATVHYQAVPLEAIRKKFETTYDTPYPIELLAYYDVQSAPPLSALKPLYSFIATQLSKSCFKRVWLFDAIQQRVLPIKFPEARQATYEGT